jgi:hypothetical protein
MRLLANTNVIPGGGSGVVADSTLVREAGGFDESLSNAEDWDLWIRLAQRARNDHLLRHGAQPLRGTPVTGTGLRQSPLPDAAGCPFWEAAAIVGCVPLSCSATPQPGRRPTRSRGPRLAQRDAPDPTRPGPTQDPVRVDR